MRVRVLGAGVVGLTTAIYLAREGHDVELTADLMGVDTTSRIAAAVWHLFLVEPDPRLDQWSRETVSVLAGLTAREESGVIMRRGVEYLRRPGVERKVPDWAPLVPHFRWLDGGQELPVGVLSAYEVEVPLADMSLYLPYLKARAEAEVPRIRPARYGDLVEAAEGVDLLVNCTGFAARELAQDPRVYPTWGQVVYVEKPIGLDYYIGDDDHPEGMTYILPRVNDVVLGGAAIDGREGSEVDEAMTQDIINRCVALEPRLAGARVIKVAAGVRPCRRGGIRLELVSGKERVPVVHNYGHGGSGFSLSWGCAAEVGRLIASVGA